MKANGPKRKIFDAVDMMTADAPQAETGNGLQSLTMNKIKHSAASSTEHPGA